MDVRKPGVGRSEARIPLDGFFEVLLCELVVFERELVVVIPAEQQEVVELGILRRPLHERFALSADQVDLELFDDGEFRSVFPVFAAAKERSR